MAEDERTVQVRAGEVSLEGSLSLPDGAEGLVLFAHGSGSSRHSPRNRFVAAELRRAGLAALLFDLLTAQEDAVDAVTRQLRFDIPLLAGRVAGATEWLRAQPEMADLKLGYFGASTGAAAALAAAALRPALARAVVSRGGRPDLAGDALARVEAPTLLIVGSLDRAVIRMNEEAMAQMTCRTELKIVEGASHLFEEPGKLEEVARLAADWFTEHLGGEGPAGRRPRYDGADHLALPRLRRHRGPATGCPRCGTAARGRGSAAA